MTDQEQTDTPQSRRPLLHVTLELPGAPATILKFRTPFTIGSDPESDLAIESPAVSPDHAEVVYEDDCWWIKAAEGSNGLFILGSRVEACPLGPGTTVQLGQGGPTLTFAIESTRERVALARRIMRLPDPLRKVLRASGRIISVEEHKAILRRVMGRVEKLQSRKHLKRLALVGLLAALAAAYAYYKHTQYERLETRAKEVFYQMKELELGFARLERRLLSSGDSTAKAEVEQYWTKLEDVRSSYDEYVKELDVYGSKTNEKTRVILRVARVFGECELEMPKEFVDEVNRYIEEWRLSNRLASSLQRAQQLGYIRLISEAMLEQHLPPQFMFLAFQESGFDSALCGPATRYGIAKGMWQFIPSTATYYGLKMGPLVEMPRRDPRDERHHVRKSTLAAARYIRDIYNTEAQASGLLVMASYNWGPNAVRGLIRALPENPRERNFWAFLKTYRNRIPRQTYDYIYRIFSAAVVSEDPQAFGFQFNNPIARQ